MKRFISILVLFICVFKNLQTQEDSYVIMLHHADSLVGKVVNGENVRELIGNVQFSQGKVVVNCDRAVQFLKSNIVNLEGNIKIQDDTLIFFGKRGLYNSNDKTAEASDGVYLEEGSRKLFADYGKYFVPEKRVLFKGRVSVQDTASNLFCDELVYFRNEKHTIARNNVILSDLKNNLKTYSGYFENKDNYSFISDNPAIVQIDTSESGKLDSLIILSNEIHSYQDTIFRFIAVGNVRMRRENVFAECGESIYYVDEDSLIMKNHPFIWYEETQISGDSIFVKLKERKLERIFVHGKAFAISRSDSIYKNRYDQMLGKTLTINFDNGEINNIVVQTTAKSLYYLYEESSSENDTTKKINKPNGLNITTGDKIIISFKQKKVEQIKVVGGVEGKYFPEKLIFAREDSYNLEGFNWRENKPIVTITSK